MREIVKNQIIGMLREEFGRDLWMISHLDIFDCVGEIMEENNITLEEIEGMLLYNDNWYGKNEVIDNYIGVHIEELEN